MTIKSRSPLRISFGGGGTDVPPFSEEEGGHCVNVTIDKYAYASFEPNRESKLVIIKSLDYDIITEYHTDTKSRYEGELVLAVEVIRHLGYEMGGDLLIHTDAPPGSGLGSSSAMCLALIGIFAQMTRKHYNRHEMATLAYIIERQNLSIAGGCQDQFASCLGGLNSMTCNKDEVIMRPLDLTKAFMTKFEDNLLLCYTGQSRITGNIMDEQVENVITKNTDTLEALIKTKRIAQGMEQALIMDDLDRFVFLLRQGWEEKKRFSNKITTKEIDYLYNVAIEAGAEAGKLLGAGGGGYLLMYCQFNKKFEVARKLTKAGGVIVPFHFESEGLHVWEEYE